MNKFSIATVFLFILLTVSVSSGQTPTAPKNTTPAQAKTETEKYPNLKVQARTLGEATIQGDFAKVVEFTHPRLIETFGSKEKLLASIKSEFEQVKKEGFAFEAYKLGEAKEFKNVEKDLFAIMPMTVTIKMPDGKKALQESALIGISRDNGANWKFINSVNQETFKLLFPKAAEQITLPVEKTPTIIN